MIETEYRAYFFGNMYLSPIQQGIQAAHVVAEMSISVGNSHETSRIEKYKEWAKNHKTMILLNGGYQSRLQEVYNEIVQLNGALQLPVAKFHEEKDSLNGALTSVGVILPNFIYDFPNESNHTFDSSEYKMDFYRHLGSFNLGENDNDYLRFSSYRLHLLIKQFRLA